jgi:hypothetical protein
MRLAFGSHQLNQRHPQSQDPQRRIFRVFIFMQCTAPYCVISQSVVVSVVVLSSPLTMRYYSEEISTKLHPKGKQDPGKPMQAKPPGSI